MGPTHSSKWFGQLTPHTQQPRLILDIGQSEDWFALQVALAPCLLGYGVAAKQLHGSAGAKRAKDNNPYWTWVENYVAEDYVKAIKTGSSMPS